MGIGVGIDSPMQEYPFLYRFRKIQILFSLYGISHEIAQGNFRISKGKVDMGQEIHSLKLGRILLRS
jgi:hypothetical protein